jgi:hypothetical protein
MTGTQLDGQVSVGSGINRIRFFLNANVTYAPAGLTSKIFEIIQKLQVFKGRKETIKSTDQPVVLIDQAQLPRAAMFSALRHRPGDTARQIAAVNPVVAATTVTAFGYVDIYVDLEQGDYYYLVDINPATAYTGGASVIAAIAINFMLHFIDEGRPVMPGASEKMLVTLKAASNGFTLSDVKEFALLSPTELSVGLSSLTFDETFSANGRAALEEEMNLKLSGAQALIAATLGVGSQYSLPVIDPQDITTALPLYAVYKSAYTRQTLACLTAAPIALVLGAIY